MTNEELELESIRCWNNRKVIYELLKLKQIKRMVDNIKDYDQELFIRHLKRDINEGIISKSKALKITLAILEA